VTTDNGISVSVEEGFAYSFKPQSYAQITAALTTATYEGPGTPSHQDIPGFAYHSESGFIPENPALATLTSTTAGEQIGVADHGTQLQFTATGVSAGVSLYAPNFVYLSGPYGAGTPVGVAVLINQSESICGAFTTASTIGVGYAGIGGVGVYTSPSLAALAPQGTLIPVLVSGTTTTMVYEIYYADSSV